jgi:hypothetical protein
MYIKNKASVVLGSRILKFLNSRILTLFNHNIYKTYRAESRDSEDTVIN